MHLRHENQTEIQRDRQHDRDGNKQGSLQDIEVCGRDTFIFIWTVKYVVFSDIPTTLFPFIILILSKGKIIPNFYTFNFR